MKPLVRNPNRNKEIFISKSLKRHNNKYLYDKVIYKNSTTKVEIVCKEHGSFYVRPDSHVRKVGCPKCNGGIKLTTKEFIDICNAKYNNKFDYSKVNYINQKTSIIIICKEHGEFNQLPVSHMNGSTCPDCINKKVYDTNKFINISNQIHNNRYDYSKANYININNKILIICKEHGEFLQTPKEHMKGRNCLKCVQSVYDTKSIIDKFNKIHNNNYLYNLVEYKNIYTKVSIICKTHGLFIQTPKEHISGSGCPICVGSNPEKLILNYLNYHKINYIYQHKFNDCLSKKGFMLKFDFYLIDYNICIEYDGIQHTKSIEYFGGIEAFDVLKENDLIKNNYCHEKNIKLIRISYNMNLTEQLNILIK